MYGGGLPCDGSHSVFPGRNEMAVQIAQTLYRIRIPIGLCFLALSI